jgi:hypothetical protein
MMANSRSLVTADGGLALPLFGSLPAVTVVSATAKVGGAVESRVDLDLRVRVSFVMDILSWIECRIAKAW